MSHDIARNAKCSKLFSEKIKIDHKLRQQFVDHLVKINLKYGKEWNRLHNKNKQQCQKGCKRPAEMGEKISKAISGIKNGMHGMVWIFNETLKISKRVPREAASAFIYGSSEGWQRGRRMSFR